MKNHTLILNVNHETIDSLKKLAKEFNMSESEIVQHAVSKFHLGYLNHLIKEETKRKRKLGIE